MKNVTVIIPTYKRSDMLPRAIESVLNQTYSDIDIIVVDDNNPDTEYRSNTEKEMLKYADNSRIKYIKHECNKNGAAARNTGIFATDSPYIAFLDDDDYYYPEKIEKQVLFLGEHPEYNAVYCWRQEGKNRFIEGKHEGDLSEVLLTDRFMPGTTSVMFRAESLKEIKGFDERFKRHQEVELLLRFCQKNKVGYIPYLGVFMDMSDRQNEIHGKMLENNKALYLSAFDERINEIDGKIEGFRDKVYIKHYMDIIGDHLQHGHILRALKFYFMSCKISFRKTNRALRKRIKQYLKIKKKK